MKRVRRDLGKAPTGRSAIPAGADLDNILAVPPADLVLVVISGRVAPCNSPGLNRRIPNAECGAIHVHVLAEAGSSIQRARHDPDVLHGTAFQYPRCMDFTLYALSGHVYSRVTQNIQIPASNEPS